MYRLVSRGRETEDLSRSLFAGCGWCACRDGALGLGLRRAGEAVSAKKKEEEKFRRGVCCTGEILRKEWKQEIAAAAALRRASFLLK